MVAASRTPVPSLTKLIIAPVAVVDNWNVSVVTFLTKYEVFIAIPVVVVIEVNLIWFKFA